MTEEKITPQFSGWLMLSVSLLLLALSVAVFIYGVTGGGAVPIVLSILLLLIVIVFLTGLFAVESNQCVVLLLFGDYKGTETTQGFRWTNPFKSRTKVSLRVRNFDSERLKVNDSRGNPIEISAVIVWRVRVAVQALFDVDDYEQYVKVQSESAIRHLATSYPYDQAEGDEISLRSSITEVSESLGAEIQQRVQDAGVRIEEARINHLAYAPEIANAMLQRQQAEAVISARAKIVDGAVGMVEMAVKRLMDEDVIKLTDEQRAKMVSNLLVVLCSHESTQPVVSAGSQ